MKQISVSKDWRSNHSKQQLDKRTMIQDSSIIKVMLLFRAVIQYQLHMHATIGQVEVTSDFIS